MLNEIIYQIINISGTIIAVLAVRYLMELSTPEHDLWALDRFLGRMVHRWEQGQFENLVVWYRVRKLLNYDDE